jgi:hypothetical protein
MKVFVSWSGSRSQAVASLIKDLVENVLQTVDVFVSANDMEEGSRWAQRLAEELESTNYGILCLTRENLASPWILFEAGALSKSVHASRVVPVLIEIGTSELTWPLAQFHGITTSKEKISGMIRNINKARPDGESMVKSEVVDRAIEMWWPEFQEALSKKLAEHTTTTAVPRRTERDMLEELIKITRALRIEAYAGRDWEMPSRRPVRWAPTTQTDDNNDLVMLNRVRVEVEGGMEELERLRQVIMQMKLGARFSYEGKSDGGELLGIVFPPGASVSINRMQRFATQANVALRGIRVY